MALNLGLPMDLVQSRFGSGASPEASQPIEPIPAKIVTKGPILENVMSGDKVNLLKFPVPFIHELDGGRFIGTACLVITRDPDEGWVNFGAYRGMVQDEKSMSLLYLAG